MPASPALAQLDTDRYPSRDEQVRQRLMDAVIACMQDIGLEKVSMRHIAERSGIVRQTVYNYYQNKNELAAAAFIREGTQFALAIAEHIRNIEGVEKQFVAGFLYVVEQFPRNPILKLVIESDGNFLSHVGMSYYPFGPFGQLAFQQVFDSHPALAAQAEEISEYWSRNALSFLTLRGTRERNREELVDYVHRRLLPGLCL